MKDGRTIDHKTLEFIRYNAARRIHKGESATKVMADFGMQRTTWYKWKRIIDVEGMVGLKMKVHTGPKPRLTDTQKARIRSWICGKDPRQYGIDFGLWTRAIIQQMIQDRMGISLSLASVGKILEELHITPRRPLQRAYQRDPKAISRWKSKEYPAIKAKARRENREICFIDESGFCTDDTRGTTYGPKGERTVVVTDGRRQRVNAISAVSPSGAFWWKVYDGKVNAAVFVQFLKEFMKGRKNPVSLVLDSLPAHKAAMVSDYVNSTDGKLTLHFLPTYAPDLNPDELVWNYVKGNGTVKRPLKPKESLKLRVAQQLQEVKENKPLVRSFFQADSVAYTTD
jgi:transposase